MPERQPIYPEITDPKRFQKPDKYADWAEVTRHKARIIDLLKAMPDFIKHQAGVLPPDST